MRLTADSPIDRTNPLGREGVRSSCVARFHPHWLREGEKGPLAGKQQEAPHPPLRHQGSLGRHERPRSVSTMAVRVCHRIRRVGIPIVAWQVYITGSSEGGSNLSIGKNSSVRGSSGVISVTSPRHIHLCHQDKMKQNSPQKTVRVQGGGLRMEGGDEEYLYVNIPLQQMIQPKGLCYSMAPPMFGK